MDIYIITYFRNLWLIKCVTCNSNTRYNLNSYMCVIVIVFKYICAYTRVYILVLQIVVSDAYILFLQILINYHFIINYTCVQKSNDRLSS